MRERGNVFILFLNEGTLEMEKLFLFLNFNSLNELDKNHSGDQGTTLATKKKD